MKNTLVSPASVDIGLATAVIMTMVGGYIDAYLYLTHQVFAFAQTGNVIFLAVAIVQDYTWLIYVLPLVAYLAGLCVTQLLRVFTPISSRVAITFTLTGQAVVFAILAFLPLATPASVFVITLSIVGGIRLELFRSTNGISFVPIATTGNLMRFIQAVTTLARGPSFAHARILFYTGLIVVAFAAGAFIGAVTTQSFGSSALWGATLLETAGVLVHAIHWKQIRSILKR